MDDSRPAELMRTVWPRIIERHKERQTEKESPPEQDNQQIEEGGPQ